MGYRVHEIFYSLQGEGARAGRAAVFCRFSGCNLWSGREEDRARSVCRICDTDFYGVGGEGGGDYELGALAAALRSRWPTGSGGEPYLVFTGGEPTLQLDEPLLAAARSVGFACALETNGSRPPHAGLDWISVSPKPGVPLVCRRGDELKLLYPNGLDPAAFEALDFHHFFLQPLDLAGSLSGHMQAALDYCLKHPRWRLGIQLHKVLGIP